MSSPSRSRLLAALVAAALGAGCATAQPGTWRASATPEGERFDPPPPTASHKWHYRSSSSAEGLVLCLGSAAIMGGAAAAR